MSASHVVEASKRYRSAVLTALGGGGWAPELEQSALDAVRRLNTVRRRSLRPDVLKAGFTAARSMVFVVIPLLAADRLWHTGWWWLAAPLVLLAGMALYGVIAIVHDLSHGSFLPSTRVNTIVGRLLGPLVLLDFDGFRRSHLDHHQHTQSTIDPKRFGVKHDERTAHPDHCSMDYTPWLLKAPLRLGAAAVALPLRVRQFLYLSASPFLMGPAVLFFGGEFSIARRDWRRIGSWLAALASAVYLAALWMWSPTLMGLYLVALMIGLSFTFHVFATHLSPNQVYWTSARRAALADALNVSDIDMGGLVRWLGHGLSNYHSTHHLSPAIPCYHLPAAEAIVATDVAPLRAPRIDLLDPVACAMLYDSFFSGVVRKNRDSWDYNGVGGMRRPVAPEVEHLAPPEAGQEK